MSDEITADSHRLHAIEANNAAWELIGKAGEGNTLTDDEANELLGRAYASSYHWARAADTTAANQARAHWLVSRALSITGNGAEALTNAERVLTICADDAAADTPTCADFDRAYGHEAKARALACLGRATDAEVERAAARAVTILNEADRDLVAADIAAAPWYGLGED